MDEEQINKFLEELSKKLTEQCWGEIDPILFDPSLKYVSGENNGDLLSKTHLQEVD